MQKNLIFILILAIIIGIFALSNGDVVEIDFLFVKVQLSQAIVIFISVLLGSAIAVLFGMAREMRHKKEAKDLNRQINVLTSEKNQLEALVKTKEDQLKLLYSRGEKLHEGNSQNNDFSGN
ncbi:LapA family protein [Gudongella oleilytica]|jgi:uncharacterized integral membrane protein|uniref:LapA family protein n=1 Tax=Gudongella oleilytica TaxID=1582259 RepID=UPI000EB851EB|nr:LapA family protein [Gudongella oleilytica]MDY0256925.1 LapA family protein [Gudongella oleilytica]HCO18415.1 DUF1049 domain-containing protein [Tissierellales bacterium]